VELIRAIGRRVFVVYVAVNMALCAVIFVAWALPRETISGLVGRYALEGSRVAMAVAAVIDFVYFWEPNHCRFTAGQEANARQALGYKS